jgi:putative FmdB family regulatory protein
MPTYDYICGKCGKRFSKSLTIAEHDRRRVNCPKCSSKQVNQRVQPFFATTSRKS